MPHLHIGVVFTHRREVFGDFIVGLQADRRGPKPFLLGEESVPIFLQGEGVNGQLDVPPLLDEVAYGAGLGRVFLEVDALGLSPALPPPVNVPADLAVRPYPGAPVNVASIQGVVDLLLCEVRDLVPSEVTTRRADGEKFLLLPLCQLRPLTVSLQGVLFDLLGQASNSGVAVDLIPLRWVHALLVGVVHSELVLGNEVSGFPQLLTQAAVGHRTKPNERSGSCEGGLCNLELGLLQGILHVLSNQGNHSADEDVVEVDGVPLNRPPEKVTPRDSIQDSTRNRRQLATGQLLDDVVQLVEVTLGYGLGHTGEVGDVGAEASPRVDAGIADANLPDVGRGRVKLQLPEPPDVPQDQGSHDSAREGRHVLDNQPRGHAAGGHKGTGRGADDLEPGDSQPRGEQGHVHKGQEALNRRGQGLH